MAAKQTLTTTPAILTGLTLDQDYTVQFRSAYKSYIQSSATAPTDNSEAFIVGTNGVVTTKRSGSEQIYIWGDRPGGIAVFDESA